MTWQVPPNEILLVSRLCTRRETANLKVGGDGCWLGMNSVVLPAVVLRPKTVVGAGSVGTKSFPEGKYIIAGNPAKFIRDL